MSKNSDQQNFDFPSPIISYICKNPLPLSDYLYKIYSACKYFYPKMKIIPCERMDVAHFLPTVKLYSPISKIFNNGEKYDYDLTFPKPKMYSLNFKLLCVDTIFSITVKREEDPKLIQYFLDEFFWYSSCCHFVICRQDFTLKDYGKLAAISASLTLCDVTITDADGSAVPVEELLRIGINIKNFTFKPADNNVSYYTPDTAQTLSLSTRPKKFYSFELNSLPSDFDAKAFSTFVKNNVDLSCKLHIILKFHESVDEEKVRRFYDIINAEFSEEEKYENVIFKIGY